MLNKIVRVEWMDACQIAVDKSVLDNLEGYNSGKELLTINTTYGKVYKEFEEVLVILHEETTCSDILDITLIPKDWIMKIEIIGGDK